MRAGRFVGRVGGLAVALGVGVAASGGRGWRWAMRGAAVLALLTSAPADGAPDMPGRFSAAARATARHHTGYRQTR